MSSTSEVRIEAPARLVDVLELAPAARRLRRAAFLQRAKSDSVSVLAGDQVLAVAMLYPETPETRELCLMFDPAAGGAMRTLLRLAHLMLREIDQTGVVIFARIRPSNRAGRRMARLAGFLETDAEDGWLWIWRG